MARVGAQAWLRWLLGIGTAVELAATGGSADALAPASGAREYEAGAFVAVPGGRVNTAGGNFLLERVDLEIDTRLGPLAIGASYNSAGGWLASFDASYRAGVFRDASGASFDLSALADGLAVPGTHWVKVGPSAVKTKGALLHEFDPVSGRLRALRWSSASYPRLVFAESAVAGLPRTTSILQCESASSCASVFELSYDAAARPVEIRDRAGRFARFAYDESGRLAAARDGLDVANGWAGTRYAYDAAGRLSALVSSEGERVELTLDAAGRTLRVAALGAGGATVAFAYAPADSAGEYATTVVDPRGLGALFRYDASRRLLATVRGESETTRFTWEGLRPASRTLPDGRRTSWRMLDDDVVSETQPSGNVVTTSYSPGGVDREAPLRRPLALRSDSLGKLAERGYDAQGRLVWVENGAGERVALAYDAEEMVSQLVGPAGEALYFADYGEHGHPGRLSRDGASWAAIGHDAVGNLTASPLPTPDSGGVQLLAYDADRNLAAIQVRDHPQPPAIATTQTIAIESRSDRRTARVLRPYGGETRFVYDVQGRLTAQLERVSPTASAGATWQLTLFGYEAAGDWTARQLANGMREERAYDALARLIRVRTLRGRVVESDVALEYVAGQLVRARDPARGFEEHYAYDAAGRLATIRHSLGESSRFSYDARSRLVGIDLVMPDGSALAALAAGYDLADREIRGSYLGVDLWSRTIRAGRLERTAYANGTWRRFFRSRSDGRDSGRELWRGRKRLEKSDYALASTVQAEVQSQETQLSGSGSLNGVTEERYGWASAGGAPGADRRVASAPGHPALSLGDAVYYYDHLSNVAAQAGAMPVLYGSVPTALQLTFNAEHNRLLAAAGTGVMTQWSYAYDAAGFEIARSGGIGSSATTSFVWNARGQIARIATGGSLDAAFAYDALGRRREISARGATRRFRFGGMVEASASDVPVAIDLGEVRIQLDGRHHFRHTDLRGNTKLRSDATGNVESSNTFAAYGPKALQGALDDDFLFAGGMRVAAGASNLILLGGRLLDPLTARFLSPDPIFRAINAYSYTLGNPVDFWDVTGASPEAIHEGRVFFSGIAALATIATFVVAAPAVGSLAFVIGVAAIVGTVGNFALNLIEWRMHPNHAGSGGGPESGGSGVLYASPGWLGASVFDCLGGTCRHGVVTIIDL